MSFTNVWINRSGKSYPVKKRSSGVITGTIGNIVANEIFGAEDPYSMDISPDDGPTCVFRNSNGQRVKGSGYTWPFIPTGARAPEKLFTPLSDYPYSTVTINNKKYKTFKARRQTKIIKPNNNVWGSVAANCLVALATNSDGMTFSGDSNLDYIAVAYVQSSKGNWVKVSGDNGENWCYAPIGLDYGSGASSVNFIGSF